MPQTVDITPGSGVGVATSTVEILVESVTPAGGSAHLSPPVIKNTLSPVQQEILVTAVGDNTVTVPTNAVGVALTIGAPTSGTATVRLKGVTGDTSIRLQADSLSVWTFDSAPASFIINTDVALLGTRVAFF